MIHIVLAAPQAAVRAGLRLLLQPGLVDGADPPSGVFEVIWETAHLEDLDSLPPQADVLLVTADAAGEADLETLTGDSPGQVAVLLLTENPQDVAGLVELPVRAWGVLSLGASGEELAAAVSAVHQGLLVHAPELFQQPLAALASGRPGKDELLEALTERELEVLQLLAQGLANKQIAGRLDISEHTVKFHVSSIYSKLGANNRAEAVRLGVQQGLVLL